MSLKVYTLTLSGMLLLYMLRSGYSFSKPYLKVRPSYPRYLSPHPGPVPHDLLLPLPRRRRAVHRPGNCLHHQVPSRPELHSGQPSQQRNGDVFLLLADPPHPASRQRPLHPLPIPPSPLFLRLRVSAVRLPADPISRDEEVLHEGVARGDVYLLGQWETFGKDTGVCLHADGCYWFGNYLGGISFGAVYLYGCIHRTHTLRTRYQSGLKHAPVQRQTRDSRRRSRHRRYNLVVICPVW